MQPQNTSGKGATRRGTRPWSRYLTSSGSRVNRWDGERVGHAGGATTVMARAGTRASLLAVGGLLALLAGCGEGASSRTLLAPAPRRLSVLLTEQQLKDWEVQEKARVALRQEQSKATYDSLKVVWEQLNKSGIKSNGTLFYCDPLQYTATVKIIGPEGGDVDFGPHKLRIPAGALAAPTVITAEAPTSLLVKAEFSPHGTRFLVPVWLTMNYGHCRRGKTLLERVFYIDGNGQILERTASASRVDKDEVDAWLNHFSGYAVGTE